MVLYRGATRYITLGVDYINFGLFSEWAWPPPKNAEVVPDLIDEMEEKVPEKVFPIVTPPIIIRND
jgi:hypothetical protein